MKNLNYLPEFLEEIKQIQFVLRPKLSKKDIKLVDFIFNDYYKNKKANCSFKVSELETVFKMKDTDELFDLFSSLDNKKIEFNILKNNDKSIEGKFSIITSLVKSQDVIYLSLSNEIIDCLDKNGFFYKYHLKDLIKLNKPNSIIFYKKIVLKLLVEKKIDISLKSLKELFSVDIESYTRFFDFEKYVLNPIFEEMSFIDDFSVIYSKIKTGDSKTNKILGLRFELVDAHMKDKEGKINELIDFVREEIVDFNLVYNAIIRGLEDYGYDYIYRNLQFAKKNPKESFDAFFIKAIEKNYASMDYHDIYGGTNLIYEEEKVFGNISDFQNAIYNYMVAKNLYYSLNIKFLNAIKIIKTKENIYFSDKNFKIIGTFNKDVMSYIKIYKF